MSIYMRITIFMYFIVYTNRVVRRERNGHGKDYSLTCNIDDKFQMNVR